jgi:hypothetical protein
MILTTDQTNNVMGEATTYSCELIKKRFSHYFFGDRMSPCGNIIAFEYPTKIGVLELTKALVFATEIPNSTIYGGVCFQRLFSAQIGSIFSEVFQTECYVDGNNIIVEGQTQANISVLNRVKDSILFHYIFSIDTDVEGFYKLSFNEEKINEFKQKVVDCFNHLAHSIFLDTQRDNF